jgi:hypothetical protein
MIAPLKYFPLIKHQLVITNIIGNSIFFDFVGTPFRTYLGKKIRFKFNSQEYSGVYQIINNNHCLNLQSINGLAIDAVIAIYDTFAVTESNEIPTVQDIVDRLIAEKVNTSLSNGIFSVINSGKLGLLDSVDKAKLSQKEFFVYDSELKTINDEYSRLICFEVSKTNKHRILLTNDTFNGHFLDAELSFDYKTMDYINILFQINHCTFNDNNKITFQFRKLETLDGKFYIGVYLKSTIQQSLNLGFSTFDFEDFGDIVLANPAVVIDLNTDISPVQEIDILRTVLSVSNRFIKILTTGGGGTGDAVTLQDYTSQVQLGAIEIGQIIPAGTSFDAFVRLAIEKVFNPTFTNPSASLTISGISQNVESGLIASPELILNFNRGSINGRMDGTIWNPNLVQNPRAGEASEYTLNGQGNGLNNNLQLNDIQLFDGSNNFSGSVEFLDGPQPKNSKDENFGSPYLASILNASGIIYGRRNAFYGTDLLSDIPYTTSEQVRALINKLLNPVNNSTFVINVPIGSKMVVFAYPGTLREVSSVIYIEAMNTEIKNIFSLININVEGLNGYNPINYKLYYYVPVNPISQEINYRVTI